MLFVQIFSIQSFSQSQQSEISFMTILWSLWMDARLVVDVLGMPQFGWATPTMLERIRPHERRPMFTIIQVAYTQVLWASCGGVWDTNALKCFSIERRKTSWYFLCILGWAVQEGNRGEDFVILHAMCNKQI